MQYFKLNDGNNIPVLGLGTFKSEKDKIYDAVRYAIKTGYRHIDCASIYDNEKEIGNAIYDAIKENEVKREELFITSKLWNDSHKTEDVKPAIKKSLNDLKLDYLDLYLIHWPVATKKGLSIALNQEDFIPLTEVPLSNTWLGMEEVKNSGLTKSIGVSNYNIAQLLEMRKYAKILPAANQIESHPYLTQEPVIDYGKLNGVLTIAYAPLGSADSDKMNTNEPHILYDKTILKIAEKYSCTLAQVLLSWQIGRGVAVIPKSTNKERIKENFDAAKIKLDEDDIKEIAKLNKNLRYIKAECFYCKEKEYNKKTIF